MPVLLGCIADDSTGATDLANTLVGQGMKTTQIIGVPDDEIDPGDADAVVIALKSRTNPAAAAVRDSLSALDWLRASKTEQYFFKYCSTFDSTDRGNIGPVADALLEALGADFTIACPAFPTNGRTVFKGHLFVGDELLSESSMRNHPLNPMTDSNLVNVLGRQTLHAVGLVPRETVANGAEAVRSAYDELRSDGIRHAIVDAVDDGDLSTIGAASADLALVTGGSGVALGLPQNFRTRGLLGAAEPPVYPSVEGAAAVLSGSCSVRTREQITSMMDKRPAFALDPMKIAAGHDVVGDAVTWSQQHINDGPFLIYSSADPAEVAAIQKNLGREEAGALVEGAMGRIARALVEGGVRRFVVAGGETSGAVVEALGVRALRIGPEIDPGVPWTETRDGEPLALALKSGNFGSVDFFEKAFGLLP